MLLLTLDCVSQSPCQTAVVHGGVHDGVYLASLYGEGDGVDLTIDNLTHVASVDNPVKRRAVKVCYLSQSYALLEGRSQKLSSPRCGEQLDLTSFDGVHGTTGVHVCNLTVALIQHCGLNGCVHVVENLSSNLLVELVNPLPNLLTAALVGADNGEDLVLQLLQSVQAGAVVLSCTVQVEVISKGLQCDGCDVGIREGAVGSTRESY